MRAKLAEGGVFCRVTENKTRFQPSCLIRALMLSTALIAVPVLSTPAFAQSPFAAAAKTSFNIGPQPLAQALTQFSKTTGLQLFFGNDLTRGLNSPGVRGELTPEQALTGILAGSGLTYRFTNGTTVAIGKLQTSADGTMTLPPVQVEGQTQDAQSAYGPGVGYVATQSAAGTKSATPIIETPQSISVVTRKQMDDQQPQTMAEALRYSAGVEAEPYGNLTIKDGADVNLRGFTPAVYLDGLNTDNEAFDTMSMEPYFLNRIEVLSGPASVLYGQASPGGVVNMDSKLPTETPIHEIFMGGGSYDHYEGGFDVGGPIDSDGKFLYRLTGIGLSEDSQVKFSKQQQVAIAPAFTWKPNSDTSFTILGKYIYDPNTGAYEGVPAYGSVLPNKNGKIPSSVFLGDPNLNKHTHELASIGYELKHRFDDTWSFTQDFRYAHEEDDSNYLQNGSLASDQKTLSRYAWLNNYTDDSITLDNRLSAKFRTGILEHAFTLGLDYQHHTYSELYGSNYNVSSIDIFDPVYGITAPSLSQYTLYKGKFSSDQIGIYGQDQITAGHWHFLMGARGDWANENNVDTTVSTGTASKYTYDDRGVPTWRVGVVYLFDNGLAPYASYSTSFQPQTGSAYDGAPFKPTTGQQYEVGVKYQPPGWNSFVTAALYNLTEQNVLTTDPEHTDFDEQTGEIRSRGVELSAHANLTRNVNLIASYAYDDVVNTDSTTTATTIGGTTVSTQGKVPVAVPSNLASLWGTYTFREGPARGLMLGGGVRYVGSTYGDAANSFKVPAFALFDAALSYDLGDAFPTLHGLHFQINANNLFDKEYVASCVSSTSCYYGLRRSVYATLKYDW